MTVRIFKSAIGPDFEVRVAAFAHEMRAWRAHMTRVDADRKNPDLRDTDRHMAYPRPIAAPAVEAAVNESCDADYVVVDDGPTPEHILREKKNELLAAVSGAEREAISLIVMPARARLFNMRENDIRQADADRSGSLTSGLLKSAAKAVGWIDLVAEIEKGRPAADTEHLKAQEDRRRRIAAIERAAAQAHHDIEDLTIDNVEAWAMPDLLK